MRHTNGLGGRHINLGILRALETVGPEPVTARQLALAVATSTGSVTPTLRSLVKAELVQLHWGELRSIRTYGVTAAGRDHLALRPDVAPAAT